ncbi:MAG TPA: SusC/RagA family TonB-linked outer membrane protein [Bacteroidales bacterium]
MIRKLPFLKSCLFIVVFLMGSIATLAQQQRFVTGIVTDSETGETLIGVNVMVENSPGTGTVTDIDGKFSLNVPEDTKHLVFSYVGYATQTVEITSYEMNIKMNAGEQLSEVVVIGYGTVKTREVTSAITTVKPEDFNAGNIADPIQLIQGRVAGLAISKPGGDPNADFTIRIRGLSTFGSNTTPLIIVDGVQGGQELLKSLDPSEVASFDVLKDASAAAIYGTRAASGVIIITTKKGTLAQADRPYNVTFNAALTTESVARSLQTLNADDYKSFSNSTDYGNNTDWMDEITQTGLAQSYNLAVFGATKTSSYRVSLNYRSSDGVVIGTGFNQLNGRLNFTQKALKDMLTFDINLAATDRNSWYTQSEALTYTARYNPTAPVYATKDSIDDFSEEWGGYFQRQAFAFYNPKAIIDQGTLDGNNTTMTGSLRAVLEPIKGLKISGFYSATQNNELYGSYWSKNAFWTPYAVGSHDGFARRETKGNIYQLFETTIGYDKSWDEFSMNLIGGYSYQTNTFENFWAFGQGFLSDGFSYNNLGSASGINANKTTMYSYKSSSTLIGYFFRASFSYKNAFFLSGSIRRDGSTMFGENNQWGNFPAVSAGVDVAKLVEINGIDRLKFRGGYGVTGNLPPLPYLSQDRWNVSEDYFFYDGDYIQAYAPVRNANPDLQWETKTEWGMGLDFFILDYKIGGSIDYYNSTSSDLLLEYLVPVPPFPSDRMWLNLGELQNSGLEFAISWNVIEHSKFSWVTNFNFTNYFDTKLVKITSPYVEGENTIYLGELGAPFLTGIRTIQVNEGSPIGQIIAPKYIYTDSLGYMQYYTATGDTTKAPAIEDYNVVGYGLPDFEFGWGNTFSISNFTVGFFLRGVFGHSLVNVNNARYGVPVVMGIQSGMDQALDFETAVNGPVYSDVHVEKADFVKLDNFSLGYTFNFPESKYLSLVNVYFSGQNLFTITNYSGVSPEVRYGDAGDNGNPLAPGIDRENTYFSTRTFTVGVSVTF